MHEPEETTWIYAGNCPVCQCGLRRIRVSVTADGELRGYVMCDECEAIWLSPDAATGYRYPHAEKPECPVTDGPLYGPQTRWATLSDVRTLGWLDQVTVDTAVESGSEASLESALIAPEDIAGDLDAPAAMQLSAANIPTVDVPIDRPQSSQPPLADKSYGSDEPRPGC